MPPDQQDVAFTDGGVAHGVAAHAVGEEIPVLEAEAGLGKGILDRLHCRGAVRQRSRTPTGPP